MSFQWHPPPHLDGIILTSAAQATVGQLYHTGDVTGVALQSHLTRAW